jgi:hypothetical protein
MTCIDLLKQQINKFKSNHYEKRHHLVAVQCHHLWPSAVKSELLAKGGVATMILVAL